MTAIFLAGGENPSHQDILASCAAMKVSVNVTSLMKRRTDSWKLDLPYTDWEWVAYCDGPATIDDLDWVCDRVPRAPSWVIGPVDWGASKNFMPVWNGEGEMPQFRPEGMVVTDRVFKDHNLNRRALASRILGTTLGAITGSIDPAIGRYDLIISGSWWSSFKFGETQVWDGKKMHRYNADRKAEVRTRHRAHIEALGVDADQILLHDPDEAARLAVASWQSFEESLSGATVIPMPGTAAVVATPMESGLEESGTSPSPIATTPPPGRHGLVLPVMGIGSMTVTERQGDGSDILEEQAIIRSVKTTVRSCDNCFLASAGCPAAQAGAMCAYDIPVEIRSKDQLQGVLTAMVEIQTQRVLQARFAEEVSGQELSPEFGREMDRLFGAVEKMRDIMDNRDSIKMTVEARGKSGVLSRLFGDRVGTNAKMLSEPIDAEEIHDAILDD